MLYSGLIRQFSLSDDEIELVMGMRFRFRARCACTCTNRSLKLGVSYVCWQTDGAAHTP